MTLKRNPQKALPEQPDSAWWYEGQGSIYICIEARLSDGTKNVFSAKIRRAPLADYIKRSARKRK